MFLFVESVNLVFHKYIENSKWHGFTSMFYTSEKQSRPLFLLGK
jgi:hypothetical protein